MRTLFHLTTPAAWEEARALGRYEAPSLSAEGFLHLSRPQQLLATAKRHFPQADGLLLLQVSQEKVTAPIQYEGETGNEFPHIYGPLNLDAVIATDEFSRRNGEFLLPERFELVGDTLIRPGIAGDEAEVASVHTHAWQQSYRGIVPETYLAERPLSFRARLGWWRSVVEGKDPSTVFVAESARHGVVGFCAVGPARDDDLAEHGEIGAIYCLDEYKGRGVGAALFRHGQALLREKGHSHSYLWVLEDNPTTEFYRRQGGELLERKKSVSFGGKALVEVAYRWRL